MAGVLIEKTLALRLQKLADEYDRRNESSPLSRQSKDPRMHDYAFRVGKLDADLTRGSSGTVSVYVGTTKGAEADSGENVSAYNRFADLSQDAWVWVMFVNGGWEIIAGNPCD